jgi:hypothetical protein
MGITSSFRSMPSWFALGALATAAVIAGLAAATGVDAVVRRPVHGNSSAVCAESAALEPDGPSVIRFRGPNFGVGAESAVRRNQGHAIASQ